MGMGWRPGGCLVVEGAGIKQKILWKKGLNNSGQMPGNSGTSHFPVTSDMPGDTKHTRSWPKQC